jgi:hypothetical protein
MDIQAAGGLVEAEPGGVPGGLGHDDSLGNLWKEALKVEVSTGLQV